jgi:hypothetical protein
VAGSYGHSAARPGLPDVVFDFASVALDLIRHDAGQIAAADESWGPRP